MMSPTSVMASAGQLILGLLVLAGMIALNTAQAELPGTLDHFKCYQAKPAADTERFGGLSLPVEDQFGIRGTRLKPSQFLCNPVDKNSEGINEPAAHLACYKAKDEKAAEKFTAVDVMMTNQFGQHFLTLKRRGISVYPSRRTRKVRHLRISIISSAIRPKPPRAARSFSALR